MTNKSLVEKISAISAMIGFCQSLKAGTIVTDAYVKSINETYIPRLEKVIEAMGEEEAVIKSTGQEKLGTAPEAAGLEPRCNQPSPAKHNEKAAEDIFGGPP